MGTVKSNLFYHIICDDGIRKMMLLVHTVNGNQMVALVPVNYLDCNQRTKFKTKNEAKSFVEKAAKVWPNRKFTIVKGENRK